MPLRLSFNAVSIIARPRSVHAFGRLRWIPPNHKVEVSGASGPEQTRDLPVPARGVSVAAQSLRPRGTLGKLRDIGLTLRAEWQEALNHPFASTPPENSAGPRDIQRLAPRALRARAAPPV